MNSLLIILSCLAAVSFANPSQEIITEYRNGVVQCRINCNRNRWLPSWGDCPPVDCGPAIRDEFCGAPDCSIPGNRHVLHPHPDPNFFWQCGPGGPGIPSTPLQRKCGCGTLFSLQADPTRCVHPHEWYPDCPNQPNNPTLNPDHCRTDCPDCNGDTTTTDDTTIPSTVLPEHPSIPIVDDCPCPCVPCIWWPCVPCLPMCPCNGQSPQQPSIPQNSWNQQPCSPQNNWNQQPNNPQNPCIQQPNNPQNPWNQQPNNPQHPSIPQVPNPPQLPWNQQPNNSQNPQNPWNQQPNNPQNPGIQIPNVPQLPWNQQPNNPQNPWNQQPNNPTNPWNQQPNIPNPWDQQPSIPNPWDQQPNNPQRPWDPQPQPIWPQW